MEESIYARAQLAHRVAGVADDRLARRLVGADDPADLLALLRVERGGKIEPRGFEVIEG